MNMLEKSDVTKQLSTCITQSESYLKARYKIHCTSSDACISHCIEHSLSHPKDKELFSTCDKPHDRICAECKTILDSIAALKSMIKKLPQSREKEVATWEINDAEVKIFEWQKHIMRSVQQSKARTDAFQELEATSAVWIRDYAQKFNPTKVILTNVKKKLND